MGEVVTGYIDRPPRIVCDQVVVTQQMLDMYGDVHQKLDRWMYHCLATECFKWTFAWKGKKR